MIKLLGIIFIGLFLIGCVPDKKPQVKSIMFQSVNPQDATLVQSGEGRGSCSRCGMNLVKFYKTNHSAIHKGKHYQYCSIHCLEDHLGDDVTLKNPQVVDVDSLKFISVSEAYYVVGSKVSGTMSKVSKYAFTTKDMAQKFQAKYGGEVMDFNGALSKAKEDFK